MSEDALRLGFAGVGWIGLHRMQAVLEHTHARVVGVLDPAAECRERALTSAPEARAVTDFDELLALGLDGVVIATPNALHVSQASAALRRGVAVFCQKPLARTAAEARAVVELARKADRLLSVDLSYRGTEALQAVRNLVSSGKLGRVYAARLVFHNAYGPDKPWFYDPALAGGGCLMDLGVHLVDGALHVLGFPPVKRAEARCFARGVPLDLDSHTPEDFALARMELEGGVLVDIACSWNLHLGSDALFSAAFHGSEGSAEFHNVGGSFYDFVATHAENTSSTELVRPPDAWGGKRIVHWVKTLAQASSYRSEAEEVVTVAEVLDHFYGRGETRHTPRARYSSQVEYEADEGRT